MYCTVYAIVRYKFIKVYLCKMNKILTYVTRIYFAVCWFSVQVTLCDCKSVDPGKLTGEGEAGNVAVLPWHYAPMG